MKSFKKHLTENIQDELYGGDSEELEYSPVPQSPDPFPIWNPFAEQYPHMGHPDLEFLSRPPYSLMSPSVLQGLIERLAWHIFRTTGKWPVWWEPSIQDDALDDSYGERLEKRIKGLKYKWWDDIR